MANFYNPFQGLDLYLPKSRKDDVDGLVQRQEARDFDRHPFSRTVDIWYLSVVLAAHLDFSPAGDTKKSGWKFIDGSIFKGDLDRIHQLEILGIGLSGDPYIIKTPEKIMKLANGLAASGLPELLGFAGSGLERPLWNLTQGFEDLLVQVPVD